MLYNYIAVNYSLLGEIDNAVKFYRYLIGFEDRIDDINLINEIKGCILKYGKL